MTLNSIFPGVKTHFDQKSSLSLLCENLCVGQDRMEEQHAAEQEGDTGIAFLSSPGTPADPTAHGQVTGSAPKSMNQ